MRETTASSLAGKTSLRKENSGGQGKHGPCAA